MAKQKIETKVLYAHNKKIAFQNFRKLTPDKYVAISARPAGTKNGVKVYSVRFRLRKGEY